MNFCMRLDDHPRCDGEVVQGDFQDIFIVPEVLSFKPGVRLEEHSAAHRNKYFK